MKWQWRELKRLWRLTHTEPSARRLIDTVGVFWLFRHGVKREHKVSLWKGKGWYCVDLAIPEKKLYVEADGGVHKYRKVQDVARDQAMIDAGWTPLRVTEDEMIANPRQVRKRVRKFLKG